MTSTSTKGNSEDLGHFRPLLRQVAWTEDGLAVKSGILGLLQTPLVPITFPTLKSDFSGRLGAFGAELVISLTVSLCRLLTTPDFDLRPDFGHFEVETGGRLKVLSPGRAY